MRYGGEKIPILNVRKVFWYIIIEAVWKADKLICLHNFYILCIAFEDWIYNILTTML